MLYSLKIFSISVIRRCKFKKFSKKQSPLCIVFRNGKIFSCIPSCHGKYSLLTFHGIGFRKNKDFLDRFLEEVLVQSVGSDTTYTAVISSCDEEKALEKCLNFSQKTVAFDVVL